MISADPYRTRLHKGNALHMAMCSLAIYKSLPDNSPDEKAILADLQSQDEKYLSVTGVNNKSSQAAFIEHDEFVVYAFRGTDEISDWLDNMNIFHDERMGGKVHTGFYRAWADIWDELVQIYWDHRRKQKRPVLICGHSLGAAMGTMCVMKFLQEDWPFTSAYLFGSPRCIEKDTSRIFNIEAKDKVFRFQNRTDIVSRIPQRMMRYSHVGTSLFIDNDGVIRTDAGWWQMFVDRVEARIENIKNLKISTGITDHDMQKYFDSVESWKLDET